MNKINFKLIIASLVLGIVVFNLPVSVVASDKININTASQQELETLNGIGPSKAAAIIEYRQENGPFSTIEEIMQVKGIGPATFEKIKDSITVGEIDDSQVTSIVINELMPNPVGSDEAEWIELKNIGQQAVEVAGWKLSDLKNEYVISKDDFETTIVPAGGFLVINRQVSGLILNNSGGDKVTLFNTEGQLIDQITYNQTAKEGESWARDESGEYNWTVEPTPGTENIIKSIDKTDEQTDGSGMLVNTADHYSAYYKIILLNELYPNPPGIDDGEWIELYNNSGQAVNLEGWKLVTSRGEFRLGYKIIKPLSYVVLDKQATGLRLRNIGGEKVSLFDRLGWLVAEVAYMQDVVEGQGYNWCPQMEEWLWLDKPTPGSANECPLKNEPPVAYFELSSQQAGQGKVITLDAGESYDPDGEIVNYKWEFSQPVEVMGQQGQVFEFKDARLWIKLLRNLTQTIKLTVRDNLGGEDQYELKLNGQQAELAGHLYISRLLPNPMGADKGNEWIELCSRSNQPVGLDDWWLDDGEGGSKPYSLAGSKIEAQGCVKVFNRESGLILNNQADQVRLLAGEGIWDEISYTDALEGYVYTRQGDDEWEWLTEDSQVYQKTEDWPMVQDLYLPVSSLSQLNGIAVGSWVSVHGQVTAEPGLLGASVFYIADKSGGVQVYSYKKNFPLLAVADEVEVRGELVEYQRGVRLKIRQAEDIRNLGKSEAVLQPESVSIDEVDDNLVGSLVEIEGELVEIKNSAWWLDDKSGEIKVYLKRNTRIDKAKFELGDKLKVSGIVDKYSGELRLLPRGPEDVVLLGRVKGANQADVDLQRINDYQSVSGKVNWLKYMTAVLAAAVIILASVIYKLKKKDKK